MAVEDQEMANRRLARDELGSGFIKSAVALASAAIVTGVAALIWFCVGLGAVGAQLIALGYFALKALTLVS